MKTPEFIEKALARLAAEMFYRPFGPIKPDRKTVMKRESGSMGMDLEEVYRSLPIEEIAVSNGDIVIPAELHLRNDHKGFCILAHGFGQNRYVLTPQAKIFYDLGYSVLMFDERHFGKSTAPSSTFGVKEADDILTLVSYIRKRFGEDTRIVVLGVSMGAMATMHAIGKSDLIDAAIEDCGPADMTSVLDPLSASLFSHKNPFLCKAVEKVSSRYGAPLQENRPVESVGKSDTPFLVIIGDRDPLVTIEASKEILKASKHPLSRMKIFPGREHAYSIQDYDTYRDTVEDFLKDVFKES